MQYEAISHKDLIGIKGLSEELLKNHFSLYEGYVKATNHVLEHLQAEDDDTIYGELKRRLGWEFDGMRLHEYYFDNLKSGGSEKNINSDLHKHLAAQFGSIENWEKDFRRVCATRGIGWAILYYDKSQDRLFNCWIGEHDEGHLVGCVPVVVCDCFEHAYMLDYGTKRADYIDLFFTNLDWSVAQERFEQVL